MTNSNTGNYVLTNFEIETDGFLGLNTNSLTTLKLFPNPTNGAIYLQSEHFSENVELIVYNIQGQVLISENKPSISNIIKVEVPQLNTGIYFVKIISGENSVIKRIIKK